MHLSAETFVECFDMFVALLYLIIVCAATVVFLTNDSQAAVSGQPLLGFPSEER